MMAYEMLNKPTSPAFTDHPHAQVLQISFAPIKSCYVSLRLIIDDNT